MADPVVILAAGRDDRSAADVYVLLLDALAIGVAAAEGRTRPPCCDELGDPPADARLAEALAEAVSAHHPRPRHRR